MNRDQIIADKNVAEWIISNDPVERVLGSFYRQHHFGAKETTHHDPNLPINPSPRSPCYQSHAASGQTSPG